MQKEYVKLRDNHRGRLRMQMHRDKVKVEKQTSSDDPTATPTAPAKKKRVKKAPLPNVVDLDDPLDNHTSHADGDTFQVEMPVPPPVTGHPVTTPPVQPAPAPARSAVTADSVLNRPHGARTAVRQSAVTADATSARDPVVPNPVSERSLVTSAQPINSSASSETRPEWRSRKSAPARRQKSVEEMIYILEQRPVPKAPVRPVLPPPEIEMDDDDREERSEDENALVLDANGSQSGSGDGNDSDDVDNEDLEDGLFPDDNDDEEGDDDVGEENSEEVDDEGEKPVPKKPIRTGSMKDVAAESNRPAKVSTKKSVASGVTKRVRNPNSTSTPIVKAKSFYDKTSGKPKSQPSPKKPSTRARSKK